MPIVLYYSDWFICQYPLNKKLLIMISKVKRVWINLFTTSGSENSRLVKFEDSNSERENCKNPSRLAVLAQYPMGIRIQP